MNNLPCDNPGHLFRKAISLVNSYPHSEAQLSLKLGIPQNWLWKFKSENIQNPSVNRIEHIIRGLEPTYLANVK